MPFRLLSDLVLGVHAAFIAFAALGALAWLRWRRAPWLHLPALAWAAFVELAGAGCPLTSLENALRASEGGAAYAGDCLGHYLSAFVYPAGLTLPLARALGIALLLLNAALYAFAARRRRTSAASRRPSPR
ncbi:MAG TPA: DUF2784 domain-containing protein [Myxococcota bacterium]|nr:DUF2784 domain-containing protein [Myxococcota bacterium]